MHAFSCTHFLYLNRYQIRSKRDIEDIILLKEEVDEANRRYRDENVKRIGLEDELVSIEKKLEKSLAHGDSSQEALTKAEEEIAKLRLKVDQLVTEKAVLNATVDDKYREIERIKQEWVNDIALKNEEIQHLQNQVHIYLYVCMYVFLSDSLNGLVPLVLSSLLI